MSIDPDALDKLQVRKADFDFALENDIKPSFGANIEDFESYVGNGMERFSILHVFAKKLRFFYSNSSKKELYLFPCRTCSKIIFI